VLFYIAAQDAKSDFGFGLERILSLAGRSKLTAQRDVEQCGGLSTERLI